ncbi:MAG: hypothetical protein V4591_05495 [Bdellovibrionota bacterium]
MTNIAYPLVIFLTHRRGVALGLLKKEEDDNPIFMRVLGKTAENLCDVFLSVLELAKLNTLDIKTLAVGTGPGSFTGLRLGCAFANGIKLGHNCELISLRTELAPYFLNGSFFTNEDESDMKTFVEQLGTEYKENDESTGFVTFFDLLDAINKLKNNPEKVDVLEPNYGREPGPVLKLKGISNA